MKRIAWINAQTGAKIIITKKSDKRNVRLFDDAINKMCYQIVK